MKQMTNQLNNLTEAESERLFLLMEECAEVQQVIGKILRFGYANVNPANPGPDNRTKLETELGDLHLIVDMMFKGSDINEINVENYKCEKWKRINKYLVHQNV